MAYKILFTEYALLVDLESLLSYIRADNNVAAERLGRALLSHVELLQDFPRLGRMIANRGGIRILAHFPIGVYYRVQDDEHLIEILHFWHGSRREP